MKKIFIVLLVAGSIVAQAQEKTWNGKFEQLGEALPTPNSYRTASGAPGNAYWQQRADYVIDVEVNDETQMLTGKETITYFNNSPEALNFLWLQLDQNLLAKNSIASQTKRGVVRDSLPGLSVSGVMGIQTDDYQGGYNIKTIKDAAGNNIPYVINNTMMLIYLPKTLKNGERFVFSI